MRPGRRLKPGAHIDFGEGLMTGLVLDQTDDSGGRLIQLTPHGTDLHGVLRRIGSMPLPPYITERLGDPDSYQTVFAREERSAAAPTAGLHFTERAGRTGTRGGRSHRGRSNSTSDSTRFAR